MPGKKHRDWKARRAVARDRQARLGPLVEVRVGLLSELKKRVGFSHRQMLRGVDYSEMALSKLLSEDHGVRRCRLSVIKGIARNMHLEPWWLLEDPETHGVFPPAVSMENESINLGGFRVAHPPLHAPRKIPRARDKDPEWQHRRNAELWPALEAHLTQCSLDLRRWQRASVAKGEVPEPSLADRKEFARLMISALRLVMRPLEDPAAIPNYPAFWRLLRYLDPSVVVDPKLAT